MRTIIFMVLDSNRSKCEASAVSSSSRGSDKTLDRGTLLYTDTHAFFFSTNVETMIQNNTGPVLEEFQM
jgi:hypothetical protein